MLILTRYIGEKIMIGDDITVEVIDAYPCRGTSQVKIGLTTDEFEKSDQIVSPVCIGERLTIGDDITIEINDVYPFKGRTQVRIGIHAPREVSVHRLEIYEKVKAGEKYEDSKCERSSGE